MIGVGIVGYGYWGPNLVRNFSEAAASRVAAVCDLRPQSLAAAGRRYSGPTRVQPTTVPVEMLWPPPSNGRSRQPQIRACLDRGQAAQFFSVRSRCL
jgi:hypothetical protein